LRDNQRYSRRARFGLGLAIATVSLITMAVLAGVGFAGGSTSASQYQYGKKVTICHRTHSQKHPWVTITINRHAWSAHERHGDTLGACAATSSQSGTNPDAKGTPSSPGSSHRNDGGGNGKGGSNDAGNSGNAGNAGGSSGTPGNGHAHGHTK
jgi:hypothetical protein